MYYFEIDWSDNEDFDSYNKMDWEVYVDGEYIGFISAINSKEEKKINIDSYLDEYNDYIRLYKMFGDLKYKIYADSLKVKAYGE